eukprot:TRINITY_DN39754_c0_g1_i1.p1 TRINITY_DN39754_c0_g1~~TRINITY_DN39754_c0_g1_i1.p1  ORF type:complete len:1084 (+),score=340.47 TRINITY_DN39754_c0_g1_i1:131-3382(+)
MESLRDMIPGSVLQVIDSVGPGGLPAAVCGAASLPLWMRYRSQQAARHLAKEFAACEARLSGCTRLREHHFRSKLSKHMAHIGEGRGTAPVYKDWVQVPGESEEVLCTVKGTHSRAIYYLNKFEREVAMLRECQGHPGVVRFIGIVTDHPSGYYLVYEYAPGKCLQELVLQNAMPLDAQLMCVEQLVGTMCHVHARGIMHRDLKSLNVIVENGDDPTKLQARLIDFGSATVINQFIPPPVPTYRQRLRSWWEQEPQPTSIKDLHTSGSGTLQWMAPEVLEKTAQYDEKCDVYSFAMVMYELASHHEPWGGGVLIDDQATPGELRMLVQTECRPPLPAKVPLAIARMITRCWATDPSSRPSFSSLRDELKRARLRFATVSSGGNEVTLADLKRAWRWEKISEQELIDLFHEADTEGHGTLTIAEFLSLYAKARAMGEPSHAQERAASIGSAAGVLAAGVASVRGKKDAQEDRFALERLACGGTFAGVFDGHSGPKSAEYVSQRLPKLLGEPAGLNTEAAATRRFLQVDQELLDEAERTGRPVGEHGGTTVSCLWTQGTNVNIAVLGDSRLVLCRRTSAATLPSSSERREAGPSKAESLVSDLEAKGVNLGVLSASLLESFKAGKEDRFRMLSPQNLRELIKEACPQYESKSDEIFDCLDPAGTGLIEFQEMFMALVTAPLMSSTQFSPVVWTASEYGVGHPDVDSDHQKLFDLVNSIVEAMRSCDIMQVRAAIEGVRAYSQYHFDREIDMLSRCPEYSAPELEDHKRQHSAFVSRIQEFERDIAEEDLAACYEIVSGGLLDYLKEWLARHIKLTDMSCSRHFSKIGASVPLDEQLRRQGVDCGTLSAAVAAHVRANADTDFSELNRAAWAELLSTACPEYSGKADVVFDAIDTDHSGMISFKELFAAIMTGLDERAWEPILQHKPTSRREKGRILHAGGHVTESGRLQGRLAVSRSLGDFDFKSLEKVRAGVASAEHLVSNRPGVATFPQDESFLFAIVASDGLWDVVTPGEAVERVLQMHASAVESWGGTTHGRSWEDLAEDCCDSLCREALEKGSLDNVTVALVFFDPLRSNRSPSLVAAAA